MRPIKPKETLDYSHGGMLKFDYKGRSLTVKKACEKRLDWKSERWDHALEPYLHVQITKLEKK